MRDFLFLGCLVLAAVITALCTADTCDTVTCKYPDGTIKVVQIGINESIDTTNP